MFFTLRPVRSPNLSYLVPTTREVISHESKLSLPYYNRSWLLNWKRINRSTHLKRKKKKISHFGLLKMNQIILHVFVKSSLLILNNNKFSCFTILFSAVTRNNSSSTRHEKGTTIFVFVKFNNTVN